MITIDSITENLRSVCLEILTTINNNGGKAYLVGGSVRDALLDNPIKDADIEVFGIDSDRLESLLKEKFVLSEVGRSFGVFKIHHHNIDIALPRRESKIAPGHKGFSVEGDPSMSIEEAASRRDFTINAIYWDIQSNEIIDPYNGKQDLEKGVIRHTSDKFIEDPLRVLRAMQFAARFKMHVAPETIELCKKITPENLSHERIFDEWKKLILLGAQPSIGLNFLKESGWIKYFPQLESLIGCQQDPEWHPEGDVWTHTLHCMDAFAREKINNDVEDLIIGFAVLCHDFGKPATTEIIDGRIRSPRHDLKGDNPTRRFLSDMTRQKDLINDVIALVQNHMRPFEFYKTNASDSAIRKLARKVKRIDRLVRVASADMHGRPPKTVSKFIEGEWLLKRAEELAVKDSVPKPILQGRHLIELGANPGPEFKKILNEIYDAQLNGIIMNLEQGKELAKELL